MIPEITLTREELAKVTGTVQPKRMVAWLVARGWVFEEPRNARDFPKVCRAYYLNRMSGQVATAGARREKPRLDFMSRK